MVVYLSWVGNGLALEDAQSGRTVMIRTRPCSILCLQRAKVHRCLVAVKIVSIATRSTVRARMYDELASGLECLNRIYEGRMHQGSEQASPSNKRWISSRAHDGYLMSARCAPVDIGPGRCTGMRATWNAWCKRYLPMACSAREGCLVSRS